MNGCCFKPLASGVVCYTQRLSKQDLLFRYDAGVKIRLWTPEAQEMNSDTEELAKKAAARDEKAFFLVAAACPFVPLSSVNSEPK